MRVEPINSRTNVTNFWEENMYKHFLKQMSGLEVIGIVLSLIELGIKVEETMESYKTTVACCHSFLLRWAILEDTMVKYLKDGD